MNPTPLTQPLNKVITVSERVTLISALRFLTSAFNRAALTFGHGFVTAQDEAWALLSHVLSLPYPDGELKNEFHSAILSAEEVATINVLAAKRLSGTPMAYITGEAWLAGYPFHAEEGVIIPRSLLAKPLLERLSPWLPEDTAIDHILELCCGSASLMIVAAMAFANARIDGVDINATAIGAAWRNIDDYGLRARINVYQGDLYDALPKKPVPYYDLIIANPPYVNRSSMNTLPPEYRAEPSLALDGGEDGLMVVNRIVASAAQYLSPKGYLLLEMGDNAEAFINRYAPLSPIWLDNDSGEQVLALITAEDLKRHGPKQPIRRAVK